MKQRSERLLKPADYIIIILSVFVCGVSFFLAFSGNKGTPLVIITGPQGEYIYPLEENTTVEIQGHQGISVIEIDQGKAGFLDSPCANKTCVASPPISKNGEWSACLPNGIFMRIESQEEKSDIDIMVF